MLLAHIIFQLVFRDIRHVKAFVDRYIVPELELESCTGDIFTVYAAGVEEPTSIQKKKAYDLGVYASNRLFRVGGSSKLQSDGSSKNNPLLPKGSGTIDSFLFLRSLLYAIAVHPKDIDFIGNCQELRGGVWIAKEVWVVVGEGGGGRAAMGTNKRPRTIYEPSLTTYPFAEARVDKFISNHPLFSRRI